MSDADTIARQILAQQAGGGSAPVPVTPLDPIVQEAAQRYSLDPNLIHAVIHQESGGNPNAVSKAGAVGAMQLMPGTAAGLGVTNPRDPRQNIMAGAKYLRQQLDAFGGNVSHALAAYNAGPGAVQRYGGVPPYAETQNYVRSIMGRLGQNASPPVQRGTLASRSGAPAAPLDADTLAQQILAQQNAAPDPVKAALDRRSQRMQPTPAPPVAPPLDADTLAQQILAGQASAHGGAYPGTPTTQNQQASASAAAPPTPNPAIQQAQAAIVELQRKADALNATLRSAPANSPAAVAAYRELHNAPPGSPPDPQSVNGRFLAATAHLAQLRHQPATAAAAQGQVYGPPAPPPPPGAGELHYPTAAEQQKILARAPKPNLLQRGLGAIQPGVEGIGDIFFQGTEAGRARDFATAQQAQADVQPILDRLTPRNDQERALITQAADAVATHSSGPDYAARRAKLSPAAQAYADQFVLLRQKLAGRTTDPNQGTGEAAGFAADYALNQLLRGAGGLLEKGLVKGLGWTFGKEAVDAALSRGLQGSVKAGGAALAKDAAIRAAKGGVKGLVELPAYAAGGRAVAGKPQEALGAAKENALPGLIGGALGEVVAPGLAQGKASPVAEGVVSPLRNAAQQTAQGATNFGAMQGAAAAQAGERDPRKLLGATLGGALTGGLLHGAPALLGAMGAKPGTAPAPEGTPKTTPSPEGAPNATPVTTPPVIPPVEAGAPPETQAAERKPPPMVPVTQEATHPASATGFPEAFGSARNAATETYINDAWQRLQAGKKILFSERPNSLEGKLQAAAEAGQISSRADVARIVGEHYAPAPPVEASAPPVNTAPAQPTPVAVKPPEVPQTAPELPPPPAAGEPAARAVPEKPIAPTASQPPQPEAVGLANQVQAKEVLAGIIRQPEKGIPESAEAFQQRGRKLVEGGANPEAVARAIAAGERGINADDFGVLLEGDRKLKLQVNKARADLDQAVAAGSSEVPRLQEEYVRAQDQRQAFLDDVQKGKTEWHRVGVALQAGAELDTGNFAEVLGEARRAKGGALDPKTEAELQRLTAQLGPAERPENGLLPSGKPWGETLHGKLAGLQQELAAERARQAVATAAEGSPPPEAVAHPTTGAIHLVDHAPVPYADAHDLAFVEQQFGLHGPPGLVPIVDRLGEERADHILALRDELQGSGQLDAVVDAHRAQAAQDQARTLSEVDADHAQQSRERGALRGRELVNELYRQGTPVTHVANGRRYTYRDISGLATPEQLAEVHRTISTPAREGRTFPTPNSKGSTLRDLVLDENLLPADLDNSRLLEGRKAAADARTAQVQGEGAPVQKSARTRRATLKTERESIFRDIDALMNEVAGGVHATGGQALYTAVRKGVPLAGKLALNLAKEGALTLEQAVAQVQSHFAQRGIHVTHEDVVNDINELEETKPASAPRSATAKALAKLKSEAALDAKLRDQIAALEQGQKPGSTPRQKAVVSARIQDLQAKRGELLKSLKGTGTSGPSPRSEQARQAAVQTQIDELERRLRENDLQPPSPRVRQVSADLAKLQEQRNLLKQRIKARIAGQAPVLPGERIHAWQQSSLLSSPELWDTKSASLAINAATQPVLRLAEGRPREALAMVKGQAKGLTAAVRPALDALRYGMSPQEVATLGAVRTEFRGGGKNPLNWPRRAIGGISEYWHGVNYHGFLAAEAQRMAGEAAARGEISKGEVSALAAHLVANPPPELLKSVQAKAGEAVFHTVPGDEDKVLQAFRSVQQMAEIPPNVPLVGGLKPVKVMAPFLTATYNIGKRGFEMSPVGWARFLLNPKAAQDPVVRGHVIRMATIGTALAGAAALATHKGYMTGSRPDDPEGRATWDALHIQPDSFLIPGTTHWLSYNHFGPLAVSLSAGANAQTEWDRDGSVPSADKIERYMLTLAKQSAYSVATRASFYKSMENIFEVLQALKSGHDRKQTIQKNLARTTTSFVPGSGALRDAAASQDRFERSPQGFGETVAEQFPYSRTHGIPRFGVPAPKIRRRGRGEDAPPIEKTTGLPALLPGDPSLPSRPAPRLPMVQPPAR